MKNISSAALSLAISLFAVCGSANATPFRYEFKLPNWTNQNSSFFGTNGLLTVTFENGGTSNASQTYLSGEITSLTLEAVNSTSNFSHTWLPSMHRQGMELSFFSTDSNGVATLHLPVVPGTDTNQSAFLWSDNSDGGQKVFQLGVMTRYGGSTPIHVDKGDPRPASGLYKDREFHYAQVVGYDGQEYVPFSVVGTLRADIPEPISLALFGIGLATLVTSRKYKARP